MMSGFDNREGNEEEGARATRGTRRCTRWGKPQRWLRLAMNGASSQWLYWPIARPSSGPVILVRFESFVVGPPDLAYSRSNGVFMN
jgi:hypothetical protein